jgi:hypothetical protein
MTDDVRTSSTPTPAVPLANIHAALEQCKRAIAELVRAQIALERMADNQDINDRHDDELSPGDHDRLWMAVKRRTINHHRLPAGTIYTTCGRHVGAFGPPDNAGHGWIVDDATVEALDSPPCPRCWPKPANPRGFHIRPVVDVALPEATP